MDQIQPDEIATAKQGSGQAGHSSSCLSAHLCLGEEVVLQAVAQEGVVAQLAQLHGLNGRRAVGGGGGRESAGGNMSNRISFAFAGGRKVGVRMFRMFEPENEQTVGYNLVNVHLKTECFK